MKRGTIRRGALGGIGAALLGFTLQAGSLAAEGQDTGTAQAILLLDASGSMWGRVDDTPKISIARDVIRGLLGDWSPKVQLGLIAYGHREKSNCSDIETLVPVGPVDGGRITTAIEGLNPKGKTPLTAAVRQAAEALRYTEERATVILVSDGKETCNADPCALAEELEAKGIDFTTHVVGFDLTEEEKAQLQCIADNTGGKFLSADNAAELNDAMTTTVQLVVEPEPEPAPKRVVKLKASTGTLTIKNMISGTYVHAYEPGKTYREPVARFSAHDSGPEQVPAGSYMIGTSSHEFTQVEITAGGDQVVDMSAFFGSLKIKNMITGTYVHAYEPGKTYREPVARFSYLDGGPEQVPAGSYMIGTSSHEFAQVEITADGEQVVDMREFFGSLKLENIASGTYVHAYEPGKTYRQPVARFSYMDGGPEQVPAGSYVLGTSKQELTRFEIAPGEDLVIELGQ